MVHTGKLGPDPLSSRPGGGRRTNWRKYEHLADKPA
jgi:hypothetical protein